MLWTNGLQVVVLAAGRGSRMTELIGSSVPKCLIPFAGNPLLFYPLKCLATNGFSGKEVLIIIQERDDIRRTVLKLGEKLGLLIDTFEIPEESEDFGTAESLRLAMMAKKITRDALILSCDIVGDLPIQKLLDLHGLRDSSFTSLYMTSIPPSPTQLPGPKSKHVVERDIVGVIEETGELVLMASEADLDEELIIPTNTLKKFPNFKLLTWLTDCHVYVVKKKVLDKLCDKLHDGSDKHLSLKGEFLPWVVQQQGAADGGSTSQPPVEKFTYPSSSHYHNQKVVEKPEPITCYTLIQEEKTCVRINSIHNYMLVVQSLDWLKGCFPNSTARAKETKIARGGKLTGVILGDHCTVGEKCKLTNVISLDHVKIEDNVELVNVIVSSNAQIGKGAVLSQCLVGPKYQVQAGGKHTNEHLTVIEETFFEP